MDSITSLSEKYFEKMVSIRRHLHQYPELSGKEEMTARFICEQLDLLGIPYQSNFSGHGVVALLQGDLEGDRCVALRANNIVKGIKKLKGNLSGIICNCRNVVS